MSSDHFSATERGMVLLKGNAIDGGADRPDRSVERRAAFETPEFATEIARILGVEPARARLAVQALLESSIAPRATDVETAAMASSKYSAFLLAACSSTAADAKSVASAAAKVIAMEFQCDFGREASSDRRNARTSVGTDKDWFGKQRSAVLRDACARSEDGKRPSDVRGDVGLTIGWNLHMESIGALHFDLSDGDVSFLYTESPFEHHPAVTDTVMTVDTAAWFDDGEGEKSAEHEAGGANDGRDELF
ncbi:hypothetical protein ACQR1W_12670 [Bradyrhizobium sp. HKCCYLS1011]|uniref:hypothetical protein n=1 Tax=Bradyrhizobium sp. HKCCYLS1011 TaxID=3420733 RepID=UPI003EBF3C05